MFTFDNTKLLMTGINFVIIVEAKMDLCHTGKGKWWFSG